MKITGEIRCIFGFWIFFVKSSLTSVTVFWKRISPVKR